MASIRERIIQNVEAALNGVGKPAELTIHRHRSRPIDADDLPATVIYLFKEPVDSMGHDLDVNRKLRLRLEHRVEGEPVDAALDPYITWGTRALMADPSFGGLALSIEEREIKWAADAEADRELGAALVEYEIEYLTMETDPEAQP